MNIKLIALDMDGTLMNNKSELSKDNKKVLEKAIKAGIYVVPATGRVYNRLPEEIKNLQGIKYVLSSNGAAVYSTNENKPIYTNFMSTQKALEIFNTIKDINCIKEFYINGQSYFEQKIIDYIDTFDILPSFRKFYGREKQAIKDIEIFLQDNINGVEKINLPWLSKEIKAELFKRLSDIEDITITSSVKHNLELNKKGANKGDGLKNLCNILNINMSEVMAFGDSDNDLEMILQAGYGIAMSNGDISLKEKADFITLSNDEDGVAYAIEKFCFKE